MQQAIYTYFFMQTVHVQCAPLNGMHCGLAFSNSFVLIASSQRCVQFTVIRWILIRILAWPMVYSLHWKFIDMANIGYVPIGHCRHSLSTFHSLSLIHCFFLHTHTHIWLWYHVCVAEPLYSSCDRLRSLVPFDDVETYNVQMIHTHTRVISM